MRGFCFWSMGKCFFGGLAENEEDLVNVLLDGLSYCMAWMTQLYIVGQKYRGLKMAERWIGVITSSDEVTLIDAEVGASGPIIIQADHSLRLHSGNRATAYRLIYQQLSDYVRDQKIDRAIVKGSAVSTGGGTRLVHLHAAELRGVALCALSGAHRVETITKSHVSKTFGERKVDEYLKDDGFWVANMKGKMRSGSREAAILIIASRES